MPVKQVTCAICGATVNKAQTLAIGGDKRACRSHPEVADQSQTAQQQRKDEEQRRNDALKARRHRMTPPEPSDDALKARCFSCRQPGLHQQDFFLEALLCQERYEKEHGRTANPFDPKEVGEQYKSMQGERCLWVVPYDTKMRLDRSSRPVAQMVGHALVCADCCKTQGIKPMGDAPTNMMAMSVVYDYIKPALREMVEGENKNGT